MKGYFGKVIRFYERWFRRSLQYPVWVPIADGGSHRSLLPLLPHIGSDLLPKMDEGSFILDYVTPPGSSLEETNRMIAHISQIVRSAPEVATTSRRTGFNSGSPPSPKRTSAIFRRT